MKLQRWIALLLALTLAFTLGGCSVFDRFFGGEESESSEDTAEEEEIDPEYPVSAGGIEMETRPAKVVSLAPALTEKLYDLGLDETLVGVSDYCDYPDTVQRLPDCGTAQVPDLEALLDLEPHLVLSEAPLPDEITAALEELEIPVAVVPHAESVEELLQNYIDIARLMEGNVSGTMIGESVAEAFRDRLDYLHGILGDYTGEYGRKKTLYLRLMDFTVATGGTFENELLNTICMDNIAEPYSGWEYPEEDARAADGLAEFAAIDVIFMDESFVTIKDLEQSAFYKGLPATIQDRYLYISSLLLERQSFRSLDQLAEMAAYAYPDAEPPGGYDFNDDRSPEPDSGGEDPEEDDPYQGDKQARAEGENMMDAIENMP